MGAYYDAIGYFRQALTFDADFFLAHVRLGDSFYELQGNREAIDAYTDALELQEEPYVYNARGNAYFALGTLEAYELAIADYERAVELGEETGVDDSLLSTYMSNIGNTYYQLGDYREARGWLEDALELDDNNPRAYSNLGLIALSEGDYDEAIDYFTEAIERDQNDPFYFYYRGATYYFNGDNREAVRDMEEATQLAPNNREFWRWLGIIRDEMGDCEEALAAYTRYIELDPVNANADIRTRVDELEEDCG
jgi:tetratricopeptide (TPR) repeat protein